MAESEPNPPEVPVTSFRDPAGSVIVLHGRVIRVIAKSFVPQVNAFLSSRAARKLVAAGRLVHTSVLDVAEAERLRRETHVKAFLNDREVGIFVEHERVHFPSFPYEWPPEMLHAAGCLTLALAEELLAEDFGLKDATPYNILFCGSEPVFIDILSFEQREAGDPIWLAYAQFVRTFLLPLLINKHYGRPLDQLLTSRRDGLTPEEAYCICGPFRKFLPPFLTLVSIPVWLAARHNRDDHTLYRKNPWSIRKRRISFFYPCTSDYVAQ